MEVIHNPTIPFVKSILGGVYPSRAILVSGVIPHGAYRFKLNLQASSHAGCDIPFHFNVRFDQGTVVRNAFQYSTWGSEEVSRDMPFYPGQHYEVMILAEPAHYKVAVNGVHFISFGHRQPMSSVNTFVVEGSISVDRIQFTTEGSGHSGAPYTPVGGYTVPYTPTPAPVATTYTNYSAPGQMIMNSPPVPLTVAFPSGMYIGKRISMTVWVPNHIGEFVVQLKWGAAPTDYVALQITPKFNARFLQERVIERNTFSGGAWGVVERHTPYFPLQKEVDFVLEIECFHSYYEIRVNGVSFTYTHRLLPIDRVNTLFVTGGVKLKEVRY